MIIKKKYLFLLFCIICFLFILSVGETQINSENVFLNTNETQCEKLDYSKIKQDSTLDKYYNYKLSPDAKGMWKKIPKRDSLKTLFLTFDACGQGGLSDGYDSLLVNYIIKEQIPVTFFISRRWALKNPMNLDYIIKNGENIDIQNHGKQHIPLSSVGDSVYSIIGTKGMKEVFEEVEIASTYFCEKLGNKPKLFRPGTAHSDEKAVSFVNKMGYEVISYSVLGDAGATFKKERISQNIVTAKDGDIILLHFNHPESEIYLGVKNAIQKLKEMGNIRFGIISNHIWINKKTLAKYLV